MKKTATVMRTTPLRTSLLRRIIVLLMLVSAAILGTTYIGAQTRLHRLSEVLTDQALSQTETELQAFFTPVDRGLQMLHAWGQGDLIDLEAPARIEQILLPFLMRYEQISSALIADGEGREFMLLHEGANWSIRRTDPLLWGAEKRWTRWTDELPARIESVEASDYDPRGRPWFTGALALDEVRVGAGRATDSTQAAIFWTDPYTFFTSKAPGLTASTVVHVVPHHGADEVAGGGGTHEIKFVIAFDILLGAITDYTRQMQVGERGIVFICTADDRVVGLPRDAKFDDPAVVDACLLQKPGKLDMPVIDAAADIFQDLVLADQQRSQRFSAEGEPWWGKYRPFEVGAENVLQIGVLIPERELLGNLGQIRGLILIITVGALLVAVFQAVSLSARFSRPIEQLVVETDRIRQGDFSSAEFAIETEVAEIGQLATAVDRMRGGLESLFKIERELEVARNIQQSTFPKALPKLANFSIAAYSESAEQTGGDTYDVVGIREETIGESKQIVIATEECGRVIFLVADATGHGIGPALSATQVRSMLRMAIRMGVELVEIVRLMNVQLCEDLPSGRFVTAWLGDLDVQSGCLTTYSAGQGPLLYFEAASGEVHIYGADELPLGIEKEGGTGGKPRVIELQRGDIYAVFSDGFFESVDRSAKQFGNDRIIEIVRNHRSESSEAILEAVCMAMDEFTDGAAAEDDRTAIIIKRQV